MSDLKCPFSMVQASGSCHCEKAQEVIRKGGSEYDCTDETAWPGCKNLLAVINSKALPALGHEDDLTLTPKSVYERIMLGGLQGLRIAGGEADAEPDTENIWPVVTAVADRYGDPENIPESDFVPAIEACKLKRRRRR